ncbi:MAG: ATP-binding cassette domain-containing protein [Planctomycetaceae bacterium]|nr:ATP-binding cassette domain-containing protein [Planctomycetaceae bacterium]MBQ2821368.1 ATP-binding cassette domain-containing protein [Thermoguttaceae bacterium]
MKTIDIQNANVIYGTKAVLNNISWSVRKGERYFILGANGAGKTTLVKILLGYLWPRYGARIRILGEEYGKVNLSELRKRIAWVSPFAHQVTQNPNLTACELVLSGMNSTLSYFHEIKPEEEARAKAVLARLNAEELLHERVQVLSSGEQVKVLIARALMTDPELMILDEPNVYLDVPGREFLLRTIESLANENPDLTLVFITQRIEDILPLFTHGMILKSGGILADGPREEVLTEKNLKQAFDMDLKLIRTESGRFWTVID